MALSHSSYVSPPDEKGYRQRLSMDALSSAKDTSCNTVTYKAKAFSSEGFADDKHEQKMVVKFLLKSTRNKETEAFARRTIDENTMVREAAMKFNNTIKYTMRVHDDRSPIHYDGWNAEDDQSFKVQFHALHMNRLESVSFWNRARREEEYFVYGPRLDRPRVFLDSRTRQGDRKRIYTRRGSLQQLLLESSLARYVGKNKTKNNDKNNNHACVPARNRSQSESSASNAKHNQDDDGAGVSVTTEKEEDDVPSTQWCLHAFTHYFFCHTGGRVIVDRLRGVYSNEDGFTLLMPTFHSLTESFGPKDRGEEGIRRVVQHHRCNYFCRHLRNMGEVLSETQSYGKLSKRSIATFQQGTWGDTRQRFPS